MRASWLLAGAVLASSLAPAAIAARSSGIEGFWANPKGSMIVSVSRCGEGYCATVVKASEKAKANARKGGTRNFIGTRVLDVRPTPSGDFAGSAFDPETNMHVAATVRMLAPGRIEIEGCVLAGLICEKQHYSRIN